MEELALIAVEDFSNEEARVETDESDLGSSWSTSGGLPLEDVDEDLVNARLLEINHSRTLGKVEIDGIGGGDLEDGGWLGVVREMDRLVTGFLADLIVSQLRDSDHLNRR